MARQRRKADTQKTATSRPARKAAATTGQTDPSGMEQDAADQGKAAASQPAEQVEPPFEEIAEQAESAIAEVAEQSDSAAAKSGDGQSALNSQITEAVALANRLAADGSPEVAAAALMQVVSQSTGLAMLNAVQAQQNAQIAANATALGVVARILGSRPDALTGQTPGQDPNAAGDDADA